MVLQMLVSLSISFHRDRAESVVRLASYKHIGQSCPGSAPHAKSREAEYEAQPGVCLLLL